MEKLIKIQTLVNQIEDLTLREKKYHSKFNYLNDKKMQIETYCWNQAVMYKGILNSTPDICIYMIDNSTIEVWEL